MSEDKREACAIAAYERWRTPDDDPWDDLSNREKSAFLGQVDAILAELRVPSEAMSDAGSAAYWKVRASRGDTAATSECNTVWQAMIDAVGQ